MIEAAVQVEYVPYSEFIIVIVGVVSLIIGGFATLFVKIGAVGERVAKTETQNTSDVKNIDGLWEKVNEMDQRRSADVLQFTHAVNNLDKTLGKIEGTLERMDKRAEAQEKEIAALRRKSDEGS